MNHLGPVLHQHLLKVATQWARPGNRPAGHEEGLEDCDLAQSSEEKGLRVKSLGSLALSWGGVFGGSGHKDQIQDPDDGPCENSHDCELRKGNQGASTS